MARSYLARQALTAALAANALRPVPGLRVGVPSMAAGWLTSELAPHLLALTALDALRETRRAHPDRTALAVAGGTALALGAMVAQSSRAQAHVDAALEEGLGSDYRDLLGDTDADLDLATPLRQLVWPFRLVDDEVDVVKDVVYDPAHGKRGRLDVYRRHDAPAGAPVLLQVHGGAWSVGDKEHQGLPLMLHMAARGWVCVAPNYRLSPRDPFPAHVVDVKRTIAWVREHGASYGADPSFVAVTGGSAGGHLAALAALTPNDPEYQPGFEDADTSVQAAVPHYGVYDLAGATGERRAEQLRDLFLAPRVLLKDPVRDREDFERASPLLRVSADAPPFLVIHGRTDSLVPVAQARSFVEALRAVSKQPVVYAELPGAQHAFDVFPSIRSAAVVRGVDRFLRSVHETWRRG